VSEVCQLYPGWTVQYVLEMPAITFFAMIKQGRRRHAYQLAELCDIHAIAICSPKYHEQLKGRYLALATDVPPIKPVPTSALDSGAPEAKELFFSLFSAKKRGRN
jgi:hypothetical protein